MNNTPFKNDTYSQLALTFCDIDIAQSPSSIDDITPVKSFGYKVRHFLNNQYFSGKTTADSI